MKQQYKVVNALDYEKPAGEINSGEKITVKGQDLDLLSFVKNHTTNIEVFTGSDIDIDDEALFHPGDSLADINERINEASEIKLQVQPEVKAEAKQTEIKDDELGQKGTK